VAGGALNDEFRVDALQGGAGTSTNMNLNEVLANRALRILGHSPGDYGRIDPLAHLNLHQSTNDTYPTALRVAAIYELRRLERQVVALAESFQAQEKAMADVVKVGRTQFQDAVLTTLGREMGAYGEAFSRDRWRIYKCEERLRVVNLGGTAIGTGLAAPRQYIFRATEHLRELTGLGLARAENLVEATQNQDALVEVSGILKALASNLVKVCGDLRLLGSGPDAGLGELALPARAAGSSIMPGKVNPVIPEAVIQAGLKVIGNDAALTQACSMGSLELNAFLPLVADLLLENLALLAEACSVLRQHCVVGLEARREVCRRHLETSSALGTALVDELGYGRVSALIERAQAVGMDLRSVVLAETELGQERLEELIAPEAVMRLGSRPPVGPQDEEE
jgi:aspartate ammonia-lyase